jgi:hypothetical protein
MTYQDRIGELIGIWRFVQFELGYGVLDSFISDGAKVKLWLCDGNGHQHSP